MKAAIGSWAALLAATAFGAVGELSPVESQPGQALNHQPLHFYGSNWGKRTEGDGTVSPHAIVAAARPGQAAARVAVDSRSPDAKAPDVIRLDIAGAGKFDDKAVVPLKGTARGTSYSATVGPATIRVRVDGRQVPVTVSGSYFKSDTYRYLTLILGAAVEGECRFGHLTRRVRIIDGNNNLRMGDPAKRMRSGGRLSGIQPGDTLLVDAGDGKFRQAARCYFGSPVRVGEGWYDVVMTDGGGKIAAKRLTVKTGRVSAAHGRWSATLIGERHFVNIQGDEKPVELPADSYLVSSYQEIIMGEGGGSLATLFCTGRRELAAGKARSFDVRAGQTTQLPVGSPLTAGLSIRQGRTSSGTIVQINLELHDAAGSAVDALSVPGGKSGRPAPPTVVVLDAKGSQIYRCTLEYG